MAKLPGYVFAIACLAAVVVGRVIVDTVDRLIRVVFETLAPEPQLALVQGDELPSYWSPVSFADPHVVRHEAGMATRAAARGL